MSRDVTQELRRVFQRVSNASISVGYAGAFGGAEYLDGVYTGAMTEEHQIRFTYMQAITPTWQGLISFNHDVAVRGQYKQDFGVLLRIAKFF
jgi:hypothetical protein